MIEGVPKYLQVVAIVVGLAGGYLAFKTFELITFVVLVPLWIIAEVLYSNYKKKLKK